MCIGHSGFLRVLRLRRARAKKLAGIKTIEGMRWLLHWPSTQLICCNLMLMA